MERRGAKLAKCSIQSFRKLPDRWVKRIEKQTHYVDKIHLTTV
jgi:hypothetical protein